MKPIGSPSIIKRQQLACVLALAMLASTPGSANAITVPIHPLTANATVGVSFSPSANTDQAIAASMLRAKKRVWIVGDDFTSAPIGTYQLGMILDQPKPSEASVE